MRILILMTAVAFLAAVFVSGASGLPPGIPTTSTPPVTEVTSDVTPFPTVTATYTPSVTPTTQLVRWTVTPTPTPSATGQPMEPEYWPTRIPVFIILALPRGMTTTRIDSYPR